MSCPDTSYFQRLTVELPNPSKESIDKVVTIIDTWLENRTTRKDSQHERLQKLEWLDIVSIVGNTYGRPPYSEVPAFVELENLCEELGIQQMEPIFPPRKGTFFILFDIAFQHPIALSPNFLAFTHCFSLDPEYSRIWEVIHTCIHRLNKLYLILILDAEMLTSPTTSSWNKVSPLEVLITRACEPSLHEPNYALHLEVAEYINTKKSNTPREAVMVVARLANHRNPHVALLALALLHTLVQSCGYPFHLQISTKEFLNELVRRFPEHPPLSMTPVMSRILETIHTWKEGICVESRWKEDLGNIRDMHRLLMYKGYRFRDVPRQAGLASAANIKSAEELEEEDRAAQSAKLQELIRRGTPRDLAAAQELMKALAGANPETKPDYRAQALNELNKLEQKVILLNEMLDNVDVARSEKFAAGDAYDQVATILSGARPKIQKWISDAETDDPESLDTFLQINDQINTVLGRYEAFKKGDYAAAKNPVPQEFATSTSQAISLIDLDDGAGATGITSSAGGIDDLADLFAAPAPQLQQPSFTSSIGSIRPMAQVAKTTTTTMHAPTPLSYNGAMSSVGRNAVSPPSQTVTPPAAIKLPTTPQQQPTVPGSTTSRFNNGLNPARGPIQYTGSTGLGAMAQQRQASQVQPQRVSGGSNPAQGKDPFADLANLF